MKTLIICLLFLPLLAIGQNVDSIPYSDNSGYLSPYSTFKFNGLVDTAGLPRNNKKIWEYCHDHVGKKVGDGICLTLVDSAVSTIIKNWDRTMVNEDYHSLKPGDLIMYKHVTIRIGFLKKYRIRGHIAVVCYVDKTTGDVYLFEQNVSGGIKDSKVVISIVPYWLEGYKTKGIITYGFPFVQ